MTEEQQPQTSTDERSDVEFVQTYLRYVLEKEQSSILKILEIIRNRNVIESYKPAYLSLHDTEDNQPFYEAVQAYEKELLERLQNDVEQEEQSAEVIITELLQEYDFSVTQLIERGKAFKPSNMSDALWEKKVNERIIQDSSSQSPTTTQSESTQQNSQNSPE